MSLSALLPRARRRARLTAPLLVHGSTNRMSSRSITDPAGPVVSLTSHGARLATVHLTIESIAAGTLRPSRLILWLDDTDALTSPPPALVRLVDRGLEIRASTNWGPHTKYFPYAVLRRVHTEPIVTADDDWLYPARWLESLMAAQAAHPGDAAAHRVRRISLAAGGLGPYSAWPLTTEPTASPRHFATGCCGQVLTPDVLDALRDAGTAFLQHAPRADDVWLHRTQLALGRSVRPVGSLRPGSFLQIPEPAGATPLWTTNTAGGGNDAQIRATYRPEDVALLHAAG